MMNLHYGDARNKNNSSGQNKLKHSLRVGWYVLEQVARALEPVVPVLLHTSS